MSIKLKCLKCGAKLEATLTESAEQEMKDRFNDKHRRCVEKSIKKQKFVCNGCGKNRPCYVEINQENSLMLDEDLKCILDETNQSFNWEYS